MKVNTKFVTARIGILSLVLVCILTGAYIMQKQKTEVLETVATEEFAEVVDFPVVLEEEILVEEIVTDEATQEEVVEDYYYYDYYYTPSYDYNTEEGVLTRDGGVNYYDGNRETWYSSNMLYHYRTPEWTLGDDGVYRDSDGYVIVASSDLAQGETIDTSLGVGKVYDSGCASGTVDIYTGW